MTKDYRPRTRRAQIVHKLPDLGRKVFRVAQKFTASLKWRFITDSFRASLLSVFDLAEPIYFVPFPTTTSWAGVAHEVNWLSDDDFTFSENSKTQGQGGGIDIWETSAG